MLLVLNGWSHLIIKDSWGNVPYHYIIITAKANKGKTPVILTHDKYKQKGNTKLHTRKPVCKNSKHFHLTIPKWTWSKQQNCVITLYQIKHTEVHKRESHSNQFTCQNKATKMEHTHQTNSKLDKCPNKWNSKILRRTYNKLYISHIYSTFKIPLTYHRPKKHTDLLF